MPRYIECSKAFDVVDDIVELYYSERMSIDEALKNAATTGEWIHSPECGVTKCSICNWSIEEAWDSTFCPNCGANMKESED